MSVCGESTPRVVERYVFWLVCLKYNPYETKSDFLLRSEEVGIKHFDDGTLHNRHGSLLLRLFYTVNVQSLGNDVFHGGKPKFRLGRQRNSNF